MRCYLHIGTEKTATKTIQSFLDLNRHRLVKDGFVYPVYRKKRDDNYWCHALLGYSPDHRDEFMVMENIRSKEALIRFQRQECKRLQRSLGRRTNTRDDRALILSSELFQSRLTRSELLWLKETLGTLGVTCFSIVVYLRNPAELINSHYSTVIKNGGVNELPYLPENPYAHNICHHQETLERFREVFGEESLIPRIFDKTTLKDGSVIQDFCDAVGIPLDDTYHIPEDENESLSALGVHLLRRVNVQIPCFEASGKLNPWRGNILSYFSGKFADSKYVMPDWLWTRYDETFQASNEWVRARFFPAQTSLFPRREHPKESLLQMSDSEMDRMADFVVTLWRAHRKMVIRRKQRVKLARRCAIGGIVLLVIARIFGTIILH